MTDTKKEYTKRKYINRAKSRSVCSLNGRHMTIESILETTRSLRSTTRGKHTSRVRSEFTGSNDSASKTKDFVVTPQCIWWRCKARKRESQPRSSRRSRDTLPISRRRRRIPAERLTTCEIQWRCWAVGRTRRVEVGRRSRARTRLCPFARETKSRLPGLTPRIDPMPLQNFRTWTT
jgi:hypothetical protein